MPAPELVNEFKKIPASNTADVMGRSCAMNPRIHLVSSPKAQIMAGPAYTVKARAGDNLALHAALVRCSEGDVIVVSNDLTYFLGLVKIALPAITHTTIRESLVLDPPIFCHLECVAPPYCHLKRYRHTRYQANG